MCGEHKGHKRELNLKRGSSPHVRGAPDFAFFHGVAEGIIPACAGSTGPLGMGLWSTWDHPRMCGEHDIIGRADFRRMGSSPHVRGALLKGR